MLKLNGVPSSTGLAEVDLLARRSADWSLIATPPSVAVLLSGFGSSGLSDPIFTVLVALPEATTVVSMVMGPSGTLWPGAPPEGSVQVTV